MMMMVRIGMFYGELGSSTLCLSHRCNNSTLSHIHKHPSPLISPNYAATHTHNKRLVASASSAPSVSGSGAEYSEQMVDVGAKKKKKSIAGIDQDELVDPKLLADLDSCFCEFKGVHIHHKICDAESKAQSTPQSRTVSHQIKKLGYPMILLHGFGASVFSWKQVMKPLAEVAGSKVLAFDRPAFGLTSRVNLSRHPSSETEDAKPLNAYSMAFSVLATLHFIKLLNAQKVILVGHSAGSLVAVNTYFEAPERVAALILVAPAIFAPLTTRKVVKENQSGHDNQTEEDNSSIRKNPILGLYKMLSKTTKYIAEAISQMMKWTIDILNFCINIQLSYHNLVGSIFIGKKNCWLKHNYVELVKNIELLFHVNSFSPIFILIIHKLNVNLMYIYIVSFTNKIWLDCFLLDDSFAYFVFCVLLDCSS
ncbi:uncharacterized protein [Glycine max]|uniref:uncharacterized protein isoform X2 n=1 Tax=Glycine max TaxID=3847 RepID=UPI0003DE87F6|nr:uncharacterized protein LOC100816311 isoform X2 [Glycine max]